MILGTCNFNQKYNSVEVSFNDSLKLIDKFYELGGRIVDTATNYKSHEVIKQWLKSNNATELKVQTKIQTKKDIDIVFNDFINVYSILARENLPEIREELKELKEIKLIEKWGLSLYLPVEMTASYCNILQIPCDPMWFSIANITKLYSDIQFRSYYNHYAKLSTPVEDDIMLFKNLKNSDKVDFVIGCDNESQLIENMEVFS